jgi:RHS repeat-associated protein
VAADARSGSEADEGKLMIKKREVWSAAVGAILVTLALGAAASVSAAQNFRLLPRPRRQENKPSFAPPDCAWCKKGVPGWTTCTGQPSVECSNRATKQPVVYNTGELHFDTTDIESPGFVKWGWGRSFPTGQTFFGDLTMNSMWANFLPQLSQVTNGHVIQYGGHGGPSFSGSGTYTPNFYYKETLVEDTLNHVFVYTDTLGAQTRFGDNGNTSVPFGRFASYTDPAGNVITANWDQTTFFWPVCTQLTQSQTANGNTYTETWTLTYYNLGDYRNGLLASVSLGQKLNAGTLNTVRTVSYTYYDGVNFPNSGPVGALWRATITGVGFAETKYYRYAAADQFSWVGIRYAVKGKAYERLKAAVGGTDLAVDQDSGSTVAAYANYAFTYDTTTSLHGVLQETVQGEETGGGCSCGGSPGLGTYSYAYTTSGNTEAVGNWAVKTVETLPDSNQNIVYTNYLGEVLLKVFKDTTSGQQWMTNYTYDTTTARPIQTAMPSAVVSFNETNANLNVVLSTNSGLIKTQLYYSSNGGGGITGFASTTTVKQGTGGTPVNQLTYQYLSHTDGNGSKSYPLSKRIIYPDGSTAVTTSYSYTFISTSSQIKSRTTTYPLIPTSHNSGDGSTQDTEIQFYDSDGRPTWFKDADGFIQYQEYDPFTGSMTKMIVDVDTTKTGDFQNKPSGWTTPTGGGLHLITTYVVDGIGRATQMTDPKGQVTYAVYNDSSREARAYPGWNTGTNTPTGPTQIRREDWTRSYLEQLTTSDTPTLSGGKPTGQETITTVNLQTLVRTYFDTSDRPSNADIYYDLASGSFSYSQNSNVGTLNTNFYRRIFGYDNNGNQNRVVDGTGTVNRTVFDSRNRVASTWIGTNDTPTSGDWSPTNNGAPCNMLQTASCRYDDPGNTGSGGVGDDTLTHLTAMSESGNYLTRYQYDYRDRTTAKLRPDSVAVNYTLDNLDQVTQEQTYANTTEGASPWSFTASNLRQQKDASYDERQRLYLANLYEVSTGGTVSNKLPTNFWYNRRGLTIKTKNPNNLFSKTVYDGAMRVQKTYTSYNDSESTYSAAFSASGNTVIEQKTNFWNKAGNLVTVADFRRNDNDSSSTGDLASNASFLQVSVNWYDLANRLTNSANYGRDNGTTRYVYNSNGTLIAAADGLPQESENAARLPNTSDDYIANKYEYDNSGFQYKTTDNLGRVQQKTFDRAGNPLKVIANYQTGTPGNGSLDTDVTVERVYQNGLQLQTLRAYNPKGGSVEQQNTTYTYGSAISMWWPTTTTYPDNVSGSDQETCGYDRLGRMTSCTDARGVVHTYAFDSAGRFLSDAITTLPSSVDGSVLLIQRSYDDWSRLAGVTSYDAVSGGNVVNDYQLTYNQFYQISQSQQEHFGAVGSGSSTVQYTYSDGASGGIAKYVRLTSIAYPGGVETQHPVARTVYRNYPAAGTLGDHLDRLDNLANDSGGTTQFAQYTYFGASSVLKVAHPEFGTQSTQGLNLDYGTGATYSGLDRFGRTIDQKWAKNDGSTIFDEYKYTYDRVGNRKTRQLIATQQPATPKDQYYNYDGLNRLTQYNQGALSGTPPTIADAAANFNQQWTELESAGNWRTFNVAPTGTANYTFAQSRTHTVANELNSFSGTGGAAWATPTYDNAGNMVATPLPGSESSTVPVTYDAWNRPTLIGFSTSGTNYSYDGLGRRIAFFAGPLSRRIYYDFYFDEVGRTLEVDVNYGSIRFFTGVYEQFVWDERYIDACTVRFRDPNGAGSFTEELYYTQDANFSTTALIDTTGTVQERYTYDPYGMPYVFDPTWTFLGNFSFSSSFSTENLYSGYCDDGSGFLYVRNRFYHPTLGRWMQRDPIGYAAGTMDLYEYCSGIPTGRIDPYGLDDSDLPPRCTSGTSCSEMLVRMAKFQKAYATRLAEWNRDDFDFQGKRDPSKFDHMKNQNHRAMMARAAAGADECYDLYMKHCKCTTPPTPPIFLPLPDEVKDPRTKNTKPKIDTTTVVEGAATGVVVVGGAYILYRIIRFIPSLAPPLWWTIPGNLALP